MFKIYLILNDIEFKSCAEHQNLYRFLTLHGSVYQNGIGSSGLGTRIKLKLIFQLRQFLTYRNVMYFNRWSRRKRGMASTPLFIIPNFFMHFPNELSYGYLRFEGNGKIPSNLR